MRASVGFKETLMAERNTRTISFDAIPYDLPGHLLTSESVSTGVTADSLDGRIACTESELNPENRKLNVVLAFSKCLNDSALSIVAEWVAQVKATIATVAAGDELSVNFQTMMVSGVCDENSVVQNQPRGVSMFAEELHSSDLKRLETFTHLDNVVNLADDVAPNPIAVISFITGEKSYNEVTKYESSVQVSKTFKFQMCKNGPNCQRTFDNCIRLSEPQDLFMYNPFTVTRSIQCTNLDGGVPVTFVDNRGKRQCFCNCPAGFEIQENEYGKLACRQVVEEKCPCVWAASGGFKHKVQTNEAKCSFRDVATKWKLPVPFPNDGYVADKRDTLKEGNLNPRITLAAERKQDAEYRASDIRMIVSPNAPLPLTFQQVLGVNGTASNFKPLVPRSQATTNHQEETTWKEYQLHRTDHIDAFEFTAYGKYRLELNAFDYISGATCEGCLVIVDNYRPSATTTCPRNFCDSGADPRCSGSAELNEKNLEKVYRLVVQYLNFGAKAINDACSVDNRCDLKVFSRRNFFEKDYTNQDYNRIQQCFNKDTLEELLRDDKTKTNPLVGTQNDNECDNTDKPVPVGQCTRCCKMNTALKEWWTDYRCGSDYDTRSCDGDSDQICEFNQCLVLNGDSFATVTASITADAKAESESVLHEIEGQGYQTVTQIHRALDCTAFGADDGCDFRAKLSELVDTTEQLNVATYGHDAREFVYWRFKIIAEGEAWQLWKTGHHEEYGNIVYDNDDMLTFTNSETKIAIEAWTQCGLVRQFFFYVHLHVNSPVSVCEKFNSMWYQTSESKLPIGTAMCAYPGSDFAELTFDFHPNAGLMYSHQELQMKVSKVVCTGALEGRSPVEILRVTKASPEIVTRLAVTMVTKAKTKATTGFHVNCVFTYKKISGKTTDESCERDFAISDCTGPTFDTPNAKCRYDACAGANEIGLYEACGGTVVKANEKATIVEKGDPRECCQGCGKTDVMCTGLLDLPNADADIMRCEPDSEGGYSSYKTVLLSESIQHHSGATILLATSALVAVVALIVIRSRTTASNLMETSDDAYYPLLE
ncbi:hypothetical protein PHMEG_0008572 [Phytophthora megakarya]|uniref:Uncharacterized protein n=1 Tax=Phytophthora megakarya TaxID=4795 RepID=A0A225WIE0_9STRA|nr:hypothetical protein PHMEG_0008572 [Phytophthora megakarya]